MATRASGFTIIETMLFLAISGLLLVGLLAGVGSSINVQRYNDATQTLKSTLQDQYATATNVQNSRANNWSCSTTGRVIERPAGDASADKRGQSACVMLGRYVVIRSTNITSYLVTAYATPTPTPGLNDIQSLRQNYAINLSQTNSESSGLEWGTRIAWATAGTLDTGSGSRSVALLILRSPESGQVYTFTTNSIPAQSVIDTPSTSAPPSYLLNMIVAGNAVPGQGARLICVEPNGLGVGHRTAVRINAYASTANAIELTSNEQLAATGSKC